MQNQNYLSASLPSPEVILQSMIDGVLIVDHNGTILYSNPAAEKLFQRTTNELCGSSFGFPVLMHEANDISIVQNGRLKTYHMLATPILWNKEDACLLTLRDITELTSLSRELQEKKTRLEQTNLELEQYASLASHDLKEPIRKIVFYADRLLMKANLEEDVKSQITKINQAAERLRMLIAGIAEFSRVIKSEAPFITVDLNAVVKEILQDLDLSIAEKEAIITVTALPSVQAIPIQMHQLFLNLLSNALKYSRKEVAPKICVASEEDDEVVFISIVDNGVGFDEQFAEKIFEPFKRLHTKEVDGTGIGLAICKKIVEVHGGYIEVKSKIGEGSEFKFSLRKQVV